MILLPQSVIHDCLAVFRRALPKPFAARAATPIQMIADRDGIRVCLAQTDICVEYYHPSPSERLALTVPISALVDCEGRGTGTVRFQPLKNGKVDVRWEQASVPYHRECTTPDASRIPFPAWPARDVANDPSLLAALTEAMQIPCGNTGRLALNCVQLRGKQGDIVATDGRQLLIQGGFQFPWKDPLLLPRSPVFALGEIPKGEVVHVAQSKTHVHFRIGGWTIAIRPDSSTRFPNVESVIPKAEQAKTRWHVLDEEAPTLAAMLDNLPAAKEDMAPITLDLTRPVVIRARGEDEKRCTDLALPHSRLEGKPLRVVMNREFLQRALKLGFRSVLITDPDKPLLCQEARRLFVWVPMASTNALAPQLHAFRVVLPALDGKNRRTVTLAEPSRRPVPVRLPTRVPTPRPVRVFDSFLNCARSLWNLVRKHHRKDAA